MSDINRIWERSAARPATPDAARRTALLAAGHALQTDNPEAELREILQALGLMPDVERRMCSNCLRAQPISAFADWKGRDRGWVTCQACRCGREARK